MEAHCIKVAIDKVCFINELSSNENIGLKDITNLFKGKKVKYFTTFTNQSEHYRILSSLTKSLSDEEQFLQLKLRNFSNGQEIIEMIMNGSINKESIELLPDIIISNDEKIQEASINFGILHINHSSFRYQDRAKLSINKIGEYFKMTEQLPFWKIRIEDRYLIKNICSIRDAELLFDTLNIGNKHCLIEFFYSGNDYDYKGSNPTEFVDKTERNKRIDFLKTVGKKHLLRFYAKAGHDRYFCTNSSLYIFGNSITSNKETHITYYPLIEYYNEYFKIQ